MRTREEIQNEIIQKEKLILTIKNEINDLRKEDLLLSDDEQRFEEKIESHPRYKYQRKDNFLDGKLVGRVYWKENFKDDDTGNIITIERNKIVRVNGEWL